jgi:hypothetical protein
VNPTNPNNLISVAITGNDNATLKIGCYYSMDGGTTWQGSDTIGVDDGQRWGDPQVAFDPDGTAYLVYQISEQKKLFLHRSTNGGVNWGPRITIITTEGILDRPSLAISPIRKTVGGKQIFEIYVAFALEVNGVQRIAMVTSNDGGNFFGEPFPMALPPSGKACQGAAIAVDAFGTLVFAWAEYDPADRGSVYSIKMKRSTDGGDTFTDSYSVPTFQIGEAAGEGEFDLKGGKVRVDSYPRVACASDSNQGGASAYVVWSGKQTANGNPDILLVRGKKNPSGVFSWSSISAVDASSPSEEWSPAIAVSPDSVVSVVYYHSTSPSSPNIESYMRYSTDGGSTFLTPAGSPQVGGTFTVTEYTFLGDYFGVASPLGRAYGVWCEARNHGSDASRQLYFRAITIPGLSPPQAFVKCSIDQVDEGGVSFETIGRWNQGKFTDYKAGTTLIFNTTGSQTLKAKQDFKQGTVQKHNQWNRGTNVANYQGFLMAGNPQSVISTFRSSDSVVINARQDDTPVASGALIQLMDPWLVDTTDSGFYESPYSYRSLGMAAPFKSEQSGFTFGRSTKYKGVFLNQPLGSSQTYYSVGAPTPQTINGTPSYFLNWVATQGDASFVNPAAAQSGVEFKQPGTNVTARYKGHLFSSGNALTNNNQRKVAVTSGGAYCYAYGSMNAVWFTKVSGDTVTPDYEVSAGSPGQVNSSPSIVTYQNIVNVIWQSMEWYGQGNDFNLCSILLRRYNASTGIWGPIENVAGFVPPSETFDATPVIDAFELTGNGHEDSKIIAWREPDGIKVIEDDDENWSPIGTVSGSNAYSLRPAIYDYNYIGYSLVWEDSYASAIRYIELNFDYGGWHFNFTHPKQVSPTDWSYNTRPSLGFTYVGGGPCTAYRPTVVWQSYGNITESGTSVHVRQLLNFGCDNWSDQITSFTESGLSALNPTVGTLLADAQYTVVWTYNNSVRKASWNGSAWTGPALLFADGTEPAATIRGATDVRIAAKKSVGLIIDTSYSPSLGKANASAPVADGTLRYRLNRHALVDLGTATGNQEIFSGTLAYELAGMNLTGTAGTGRQTLAPLLMASQPFTVEKDMSQLTIAGAIYGAQLGVPAKVSSFSTEPLARLLVRDVRTQSVVRDLWTVPFSALASVSDNSFGIFRESSADLTDLAGREVSVEVELLGKTRGAEPIIVTDYLILKNQQAELARNESQTRNPSVPTTFALHQNYPNPFNPTTIIAFDLPEAKHVHLVLYNVLGEEIQMVVDEDLPQGFHTRHFAASDLPSGTYFYRLTAGSYCESRKMVVLK